VQHREPVTIVPSATRARFSVIVVLARLVWWCATILWLHLVRGDGAAEYGRRFRQLLEDLGGLWVKLGQLLSLRVDLFPLAFCRELAHLQVKAIGFPVADALQIVQSELGHPIDTLFEEFETLPVAAASMGQVHLARLRESGLRVAVKVQRPSLPSIFREQLRIIELIVWSVRRLRFRPNLRWEELVWELTQIMQEEMDCRYEAAATRRMRRTLKGHGIYAPKVFYATERVLVTEFIDGVLMADYIHAQHTGPARLQAWLEENRIEPQRVGRTLVRSLLRQILEDNFFHADLHPGNVMLLRDNRVALIDFGAGSFTERQYLERFRLTVRALSEGDYTRAAELNLLLCGPLPPVDLDAIRDASVRAMRRWAAKTIVPEVPYHEKSVAVLYNELIRILYEHHCTMEWALLRIRRAQETLDASLLYLIPDVDYSQIAAEYFRAADRRSASMARQARHMRETSPATLTTALKVIESAEEFTLFRAPLIRKYLHRAQATTTRVGDVIIAAVTGLTWCVAVSTVLLALTFAAQRSRGQLARLAGGTVGQWAATVPPLDVQVWTIVLIGAMLWWRALSRLRLRMLRHDVGPGEEATLL
jgi:ubiquinone biosynthesis protein